MADVLSSEIMASSRRTAGAPASKGELIRLLRVARELTQEDVAESAGISVWQLSRIERGKSEPNRETLERLAPILGVTPAYLDIRALTDAVAERATDPVARSVVERVLALNDRIAAMPDRQLKRLFRLLDKLERGGDA